jgi:hypothetical protein
MTPRSYVQLNVRETLQQNRSAGIFNAAFIIQTLFSTFFFRKFATMKQKHASY